MNLSRGIVWPVILPPLVVLGGGLGGLVLVFGVSVPASWLAAVALTSAVAAFAAARPTAVRLKRTADSLEKLVLAHADEGDSSTQVMGVFARIDHCAELLAEIAAEKNRLEVDARMAAAMEQSAIKQVEAAAERSSEQQRVQALEIADRAEASVQQSVGELETSAATLEEIAGSMSQISAAAIASSHTTEQSTRETTGAIEQAAAAATQLSTSLTQVASELAESSQMTGVASERASHVNDGMQSLAAKTQEIGSVVEVITDIASMTSLLALNASIEAASAGDAGRGFAVVANEVKELATQTAQATTLISDHIGEVQSLTGAMVDGMEEMARSIEDVSERTNSISASVVEQSHATEEIASRAEVLAASSSSLSSVVDDLASQAEAGGGAAEQLQGASTNLSALACDLSGRVSELLADLRSGSSGSEAGTPAPSADEAADAGADADDSADSDDFDFFV